MTEPFEQAVEEYPDNKGALGGDFYGCKTNEIKEVPDFDVRQDDNTLRFFVKGEEVGCCRLCSDYRADGIHLDLRGSGAGHTSIICSDLSKLEKLFSILDRVISAIKNSKVREPMKERRIGERRAMAYISRFPRSARFDDD